MGRSRKRSRTKDSDRREAGRLMAYGDLKHVEERGDDRRRVTNQDTQHSSLPAHCTRPTTEKTIQKAGFLD
jgi:hypothetical protein